MDQHGPQISVATLAHAQEILLAAAGMLAWNEPQPGSKLPAVVEVLRIANGCHQSGCGERADSWFLLEALAHCIVAVPGLDCSFNLVDLAMQQLQMLEQSVAQQAERARQRVAGIFDELGR